MQIQTQTHTMQTQQTHMPTIQTHTQTNSFSLISFSVVL
jgi:hypothetical protein